MDIKNVFNDHFCLKTEFCIERERERKEIKPVKAKYTTKCIYHRLKTFQNKYLKQIRQH